jgi:hypothetical protein
VLHVFPAHFAPGILLAVIVGGGGATEAADRELWVGAQDPVAEVKRMLKLRHPAAQIYVTKLGRHAEHTQT